MKAEYRCIHVTYYIYVIKNNRNDPGSHFRAHSGSGADRTFCPDPVSGFRKM